MAEASSPREAFESRHARGLAPWAVREADSGGRAVSETAHPYRTCFQRDRDRVVHCSAFRRLDFKTQVFVPHEHDHFRTRLTHTLEVSQIGRCLGRALGLNEDLIEAAALAHDLGHPPFGHGGEEMLDELMAEEGGFEHNHQTLRVVDYLEHPYPAFRGLNLTRVVRECLAKHRTRYDAPLDAEFDAALQAPLEGQVVDLADEIAYTAADLEDALAAGWTSAERLEGLSLWRRAWAAAEADAPEARSIHKRIRACKAVLAAMADDVIATTGRQIEQAGVEGVQDVRRAGCRLVGFSQGVAGEVAQLEGFLREKVYDHPESLEHRAEGRRIIGELFGLLAAEPAKLPRRYESRVEHDGLKRVVCDYVAGMTDRFCRNQHAILCCPGR